MANIIVGNPVDFQSVVGQKQFINTLFKRHGILLSVSDEDKSNYIVDKKDTITAEIEAKLKDPTSIRDYQELSYLLSFVNGWEPGKDTATYNQANTYAK
ncbi:MAG: hypothetical protein H6767_06610 [Candidatus Peribacteria bacterium]|nr:MAG: hypothetical protein H6767_06610 [Candidatus Peribacteria bacterium]